MNWTTRESFKQLKSFYSSDIATGVAIKYVYEHGTADMVMDVAVYPRDLILGAYEQSHSLALHPTATQIDSINLDDLSKYLGYVLSGKGHGHTTKVNRLVFSIGQDICRAATKGKCRLPKQILICMTLWHLFRSDELIIRKTTRWH